MTVSVEGDGRIRCTWADFTGSRSAAPDSVMYRDYHDYEWGRRLRGTRELFERMSLEAFQSGLSWLIILRKRENFRRAFKQFDVSKVARFTERDVDRLMADTGIVRNRAKVEATIANARAVADRSHRLRGLVPSTRPVCPRSLPSPRRWQRN
jgi:DNA-3-methyladenine glycosylase I